MIKLLTWIFGLYIILSPFYIFSSGLPQPADFIMTFGILLMLFSFNSSFLRIIPIAKLTNFTIIVVLVAVLNQIYFNLGGFLGSPLFASIFYIYNSLSFILVFYMYFNSYNKNTFFNNVGWFLFVSISVQFIASILDLGKTEGRAVLFFNNPNQLGYFALLIFSIFTIVPSKARSNKTVVVILIMMSGYLMLLSQSRAAFIGVLSLSVIVIIKESMKFNFKSLLFLLLFGILVFFTFNESSYVQDKLDGINQRQQMRGDNFEEEIGVRGYDRIFLYPEYLIFGAGELWNVRFPLAHHQGEMHSGLGTIIFSYGILGIITFIIFVFSLIKYNFVYNIIVILPVALYNLTHQGLRNTLLWVFFAFIYLVSLEEHNEMDVGNQQSI